MKRERKQEEEEEVGLAIQTALDPFHIAIPILENAPISTYNQSFAIYGTLQTVDSPSGPGSVGLIWFPNNSLGAISGLTRSVAGTINISHTYGIISSPVCNVSTKAGVLYRNNAIISVSSYSPPSDIRVRDMERVYSAGIQIYSTTTSNVGTLSGTISVGSFPFGQGIRSLTEADISELSFPQKSHVSSIPLTNGAVALLGGDITDQFKSGFLGNTSLPTEYSWGVGMGPIVFTGNYGLGAPKYVFCGVSSLVSGVSGTNQFVPLPDIDPYGHYDYSISMDSISENHNHRYFGWVHVYVDIGAGGVLVPNLIFGEYYTALGRFDTYVYSLPSELQSATQTYVGTGFTWYDTQSPNTVTVRIIPLASNQYRPNPCKIALWGSADPSTVISVVGQINAQVCPSTSTASLVKGTKTYGAAKIKSDQLRLFHDETDSQLKSVYDRESWKKVLRNLSII